MARRSQLITETSRVVTLAVALVGMHAARGAGADLSGFLGVWTFQLGSQVQAACTSLGDVSQGIDGGRVSIYPGTSTDLVFDIGCRCTIGLNVTGNQATIAGPQSCLVIPHGFQLSGDLSELTLNLSAAGDLSVTLAGNGGTLTSESAACDLSSLSGSGTLARTGTGAITCGDPTTAIGVIPYSPLGTTDCPFGAGLEGLRIRMFDEDQPARSDSSGSHGEGWWVLPDDARQGPPIYNNARYTVLHFCRVDGTSFKPIATSADPAQFYAVLKLGTVCPRGSVEIRKTIDNEDAPQPPAVSVAVGDLGPNSVSGDPGLSTFTRLSFCYFRGAAAGDPVMAGFPDLGVPYAVFHRFAGEQPPWVMLKRWEFSNDEDTHTKDDQYFPTDDEALLTEFKGVIENPSFNTFFNMARVR